MTTASWLEYKCSQCGARLITRKDDQTPPKITYGDCVFELVGETGQPDPYEWAMRVRTVQGWKEIPPARQLGEPGHITLEIRDLDCGTARRFRFKSAVKGMLAGSQEEVWIETECEACGGRIGVRLISSRRGSYRMGKVSDENGLRSPPSGVDPETLTEETPKNL